MGAKITRPLRGLLSRVSAITCRPADDAGVLGMLHATFIRRRHTNAHCLSPCMHGLTNAAYRGLEHVLDRDMVVDTTLVGTVLNGLVQASRIPWHRAFACFDVSALRVARGLASFAHRTSIVPHVQNEKRCVHRLARGLNAKTTRDTNTRVKSCHFFVADRVVR